MHGFWSKDNISIIKIAAFETNDGNSSPHRKKKGKGIAFGS